MTLGTSCKWNFTVFIIYDWLVSLSTMSSEFIHVSSCVRTSFLFKAEQYSAVRTDHILFIHHLGILEFFYLLVTVENAAMNIRCKHLFETLLLILFGVYPVAYMVFKKERSSRVPAQALLLLLPPSLREDAICPNCLTEVTRGDICTGWLVCSKAHVLHTVICCLHHQPENYWK